jgi:hypothetical protein
MHNSKLLMSAVIAAISAPCFAQDFIGISYNAATGATSRGSLSTAAGEYIARIDGSEIAGWGTAAPGSRTITSIAYVVQDQSDLTPEVFNIKLYPEDVANPGFPDLAAGVVYATGVTGPPLGTGAVSAVAKNTPPDVVGVGDSVPIQGGGDVFVSFELPANAGWSTDGLSIHTVLGYAPNASFTVFDLPNPLVQGGSPPPAATPVNSRALSRIGAGAAAYNARRNLNLDIAHSTAGGRALAITNQTSFACSNNPPPAGWGPAPGTGDFLSGVNPDVTGFGNPGRADDIAMEYFRTGIGSGALVVFLMEFNTSFAIELPISFYGFSGTGVSCLNVIASSVIGIGFTAADEAWLVTSIPAAARPTLSGLPVIQQAAALDAAGAIHASPCSKQVF